MRCVPRLNKLKEIHKTKKSSLTKPMFQCAQWKSIFEFILKKRAHAIDNNKMHPTKREFSQS